MTQTDKKKRKELSFSKECYYALFKIITLEKEV